ncbi:acyltransferase family protein [Flavobacterium sp. N1736]|uniref:acyltransferase family protein n=1 Tax=Flavobacterium sp. N1736 TaxID=2986823 RepID=UPI0022245BC0|nr:acyltransferase [Flavobacterium sp. N1736]
MNKVHSEITASKSRIAILDGFRAIAIISVILYHYFFRWNDTKYPYFGGNYFHYGFKGVPFFFIISGFVICYSLESTKDFISFWKKRLIRLFPSIVIASVLTYCFILAFDHQHTFSDNYLRNLIISITFLPPNFYNLFSEIPNYFGYINYDYWSLWPEVQFYFLASILYFADKRNFKRNFIVVCFILLVSYNILLFLNFNHIKLFQKFTNLFNLIKHLSFFMSGALFYMLYNNKQNIYYIVFLLFSFIMINYSFDLPQFIASTIMFLLFFCFLYYPKFLLFLENRFLVKIGASSYFLYLIHDYIGAVWIKNIVGFFYPNSFIAPVLMIIIMVSFSILYTQKVESKIAKYLHTRLLKRND